MAERVNSVSVHYIDEEKLKYRVIIAIDGGTVPSTDGSYQLVLPPLTAFGNSDHYDQALIKLDSVVCSTIDNAVNDQVWSVLVGGARVRNKCPAIEVRMNAPSGQTALNTQTQAIATGVGVSQQGNFRQLVPLRLELTGAGTAALLLGVGPAAPGGDSAGGLSIMGDYSWIGDCSCEGVMCGNPFGGQLTLQNRFPITDSLAYLVSHAAGAATADIGLYQYQFTITMIPRQ